MADEVTWGSSRHRFCEAVPVKSRRRCRSCPAVSRNRVTHHGRANGVTLMEGCEFHVHQWVRQANERRRKVGVPQ